ncbi:hypothetical protein DFH08DRAFT_826506 [Mycena albidolilacea]|uniref:Uncharacterized protein n=1 Tax=Mycena albidolilacea TaxID=1033008 RepID=A0AAD7E863_9AGAR|nr:hypothetical protein DFH08DRAFT_826506 [Mycena albidolilacea]
MFSRCNHHDQTGPAHNPAPSTQPVSPSLPGDFLPHSVSLSAHYSRLESLLDSAIAMLMFICDSAPATALPALSGHTTEVLHALHAPLGPRPDTLAPTVSPPPSPTPAPKPTTYAEVMVCTATDQLEASTETNAPHPKRAEQHLQPPDLVFCFDCPPFISLPLTFRPHPACMFIDIKGKSITGDLSLTGIQWTTKGNLTFTFHHDKKFTPVGAMKLAPVIWAFIRPQFKLPETHPGPRMDHGGHWHTVVVHAVPIVPVSTPIPASGDRPDVIQKATVYAARNWLHLVDIQEASLMCSNTDLPTRQNAPLRLSLTRREDADSLMQNGALVLGSQCHVS